MHVVEIFLPLARRDGESQPSALFTEVRKELVDRFGGVTAFARAPADGQWENEEGRVERDRIVIFEVMDERFDKGWWRDFRRGLEKRFEQEEVLVRAVATERL